MFRRRRSTRGRDGALTWLRDHAMPVDGAEDSALLQVLGDARVVALGESTHGSHEHHALQSGITKALIEHLGFRTLFLEANWGEVRALNRYVLGDADVDPADALRRVNYFTIGTSDTLKMIQWIRRFNVGRDMEDRVRVVGVDFQSVCGAMDAVLSFAAGYNEPLHAEVSERYQLLHRIATDRDLAACAPDCKMTLESMQRYRDLARFQKSKIATDVVGVLDGLQAEEMVASVTTTNDGELQAKFSEARVAAEALVNSSRSLRVSARYLGATPILIARSLAGAAWDRFVLRRWFSRDATMASMLISDLQASGGNDGRAVVWAHNLHILIRGDTVGTALRKEFGPQFVAVPMAFGSGRFRAKTMASRLADLGDVTEHQIGAPEADSYEAAFAEVASECFAVDLRAIPEGSAAAAWFDEKHSLRAVGAAYSEKYESRVGLPTRLSREADVLVYVAESTPAHALEADAPSD